MMSDRKTKYIKVKLCSLNRFILNHRSINEKQLKSRRLKSLKKSIVLICIRILRLWFDSFFSIAEEMVLILNIIKWWSKFSFFTVFHCEESWDIFFFFAHGFSFLCSIRQTSDFSNMLNDETEDCFGWNLEESLMTGWDDYDKCLEGSEHSISKGCDKGGKSCNTGIFHGLQRECISRNIFPTVPDDNVALVVYRIRRNICEDSFLSHKISLKLVVLKI